MLNFATEERVTKVINEFEEIVHTGQDIADGKPDKYEGQAAANREMYLLFAKVSQQFFNGDKIGRKLDNTPASISLSHNNSVDGFSSLKNIIQCTANARRDVTPSGDVNNHHINQATVTELLKECQEVTGASNLRLNIDTELMTSRIAIEAGKVSFTDSANWLSRTADEIARSDKVGLEMYLVQAYNLASSTIKCARTGDNSLTPLFHGQVARVKTLRDDICQLNPKAAEEITEALQFFSLEAARS